MRDRLTALGWSEIEVIDDDLGRSAAGGVQGAGFERMVAQVCLGKIGAVAAREVSRFARNSRDWQQLIEMCRVVDTVLIDQETIYAPRHGNDRLLLGLKGSLNEYELDLLRQRSLSARYEKARRCGRKLTLRYTGAKHQIPRYSCSRGWMDNGELRCIAFGGLRVDDAIEQALLTVVGPGAIAAALAAENEAKGRRDQVREVLNRDLEAARYAADRAFRQYDAADPVNRLVAGELEARWNKALTRVTEVEGKIADHDTATVAPVVDPGSLATLAADLQDRLDRPLDRCAAEEADRPHRHA